VGGGGVCFCVVGLWGGGGWVGVCGGCWWGRGEGREGGGGGGGGVIRNFRRLPKGRGEEREKECL